MRAPAPRSDSWLPPARSRPAALAVAAGLLLLPAAASAVETAPTCTGLEPGPTRTVTRVLDGETMALDDGTEVRLVGALAPQAIDADADAGAWPAETATVEALRALVLAKSVALGFAGERTDRYGRLQAQAFLVESEGRPWVQGRLVEQGLARAYALGGGRACSEALLAAERSAREARRGLWAEAAYQARPADRPVELMRYRTTFQIVEGRIVRIAQVRDTLYLNFDRDWRHAFSASLRREDAALLGTYAGRPKALEGRTVRVHGWIDERDGAPVVDLSTAGLVEVLDDPDGAPGRAR